MKEWLLRRFLPQWCREELLDENKRLRAQMNELRQDNARLRSYISGMQTAMRAGRRITINNGGVEHGTVGGDPKRQSDAKHRGGI